MAAPLWTILIATLGQRRELLRNQLGALMPQVERAAGAVKVLAAWDNGESRLDVKRQSLVDAVDTEYLSFIDDDDLVRPYFVAAVLRALERRPDYVGFKVQTHRNGRPWRIATHRLEYDGWYRVANQFRRDITHANPMRTAIARTADFRGNMPEDKPWAAQLRAGGLLQDQVFIDKIMYDYLWVPAQSSWTRPGRITPTDPDGRPWEPLTVDSPHFAYLGVSDG